ncbi:hypothetical protein CF54_08670 [Streptomyces sp. Tu 6176]|nr:hypothetical protein CF54_08670 [Streptomyces sp. Tu 6176]
MVLDESAVGLPAGGVQRGQGDLQGLFALGLGRLALRGAALARGLVDLAERDVVDGPQQPVGLVAARLEQYVEGDLLLPVQCGDELHVGGRQGLLDHQYACEHQTPFLV